MAGLGLGVYLLTLAATLPARLVVPLPGAGGTLWHGGAPVAGGYLEWHWSPGRSLTGLGFAADLEMRGAQTALTARALVRPGGRLLLESVHGTADGGLLGLARPSFACAVRMRIDLPRLAIGGGRQGAEGRVRSEPGQCAPFGGTPVAVPALALDLRQTPGMTVINLAPTGAGRRPYAVGGLDEEGRLRLIVTGEGAAALPFLAPPGGLKIETAL